MVVLNFTLFYEGYRRLREGNNTTKENVNVFDTSLKKDEKIIVVVHDPSASSERTEETTPPSPPAPDLVSVLSPSLIEIADLLRSILIN